MELHNPALLKKEIEAIYLNIKPDIESRINEFNLLWTNGSDRELFIELTFCLLTPQSSARSCWRAANSLIEKNLLFNGSFNEIREELNIVRFRNKKAGYIIEARDKFTGQDIKSLRSFLSAIDSINTKREWLVKNIKGIGYKEASHFLRNIGMGNELAILDRHVLKNMKLLCIIDEIPKSISRKIYLRFEELLREFSFKIEIPLGHLDFILWYRETGEVFK